MDESREKTESATTDRQKPARTDLGIIKPKRLSGETRLTHTGHLKATVGDFWQWAYSDLVNNTTRGVLAEYLVAKAVGARSQVRDPWARYDVEDPRGISIEVKSSAYIQSWWQSKLSAIKFVCPPTLGWDPSTDEFDAEASRHAVVYVFALLAHQDQKTLNPLDVSQWEFYVVPTWWLDARKRSQHSIGLKALRNIEDYGAPVAFRDLGPRIAQVAAMPPDAAQDKPKGT